MCGVPFKRLSGVKVPSLGTSLGGCDTKPLLQFWEVLGGDQNDLCSLGSQVPKPRCLCLSPWVMHCV